MKADDENYITKTECIAKGIIRSGRNYYRQSLLERLAAREKGRGLDWKINKYSVNDRLSCGLELARDFSRSKMSDVPTNDTTKVRVDGGGKRYLSESSLDAEQRYLEAMKSIPHPEIRQVIYAACIEENLSLSENNGCSYAIKKKEAHMLRALLCMGLDFLCAYYLK